MKTSKVDQIAFLENAFQNELERLEDIYLENDYCWSEWKKEAYNDISVIIEIYKYLGAERERKEWIDFWNDEFGEKRK